MANHHDFVVLGVIHSRQAGQVVHFIANLIPQLFTKIQILDGRNRDHNLFLGRDQNGQKLIFEICFDLGLQFFISHKALFLEQS
jgi:hypothetical protein